MDIFPGITDISVPNRVFNHILHGEFNNIKLRRFDIEATTTETSDGTHYTYHKSQLSTNTPKKENILNELQLERTRVLDTFQPVEEAPANSIDDLF